MNEAKLTYRPEEIKFSSADGTPLVGWYFSSGAKQAKGIIVFFHGNGQNLSAHFVALYWILEKGYDFFVFDYPGYGGSGGEPSPKSTVRSGQAALLWAKRRAPEVPLSVFGQSLGGIVAQRALIELGEQMPVCLLALESTFSSYQSVGRQTLASSPLTWLFQPLSYLLVSDNWASRGRLSEIRAKHFVVIHGTADRTVRYVQGQKVFDELSEPKEFWSVEGGKHIDAFSGSHRLIYRNRYLEALRRSCEPNY